MFVVKTFAVHQKSVKTTKLFSRVTLQYIATYNNTACWFVTLFDDSCLPIVYGILPFLKCTNKEINKNIILKHYV